MNKRYNVTFRFVGGCSLMLQESIRWRLQLTFSLTLFSIRDVVVINRMFYILWLSFIRYKVITVSNTVSFWSKSNPMIEMLLVLKKKTVVYSAVNLEVQHIYIFLYREISMYISHASEIVWHFRRSPNRAIPLLMRINVLYICHFVWQRFSCMLSV